LHVGLGFGGLFAYFAFSYHGIAVEWWGNSEITCYRANMVGISTQGVDAKGIRWFTPPEEGFGPKPGEFE
jgi:hypothetical protein